ncbi:uncharacterized protein LOC133175165 [Saccostrea echinata]|uniref:uncharacterized protein LOC133175165 n=1 Tax=Saccostrea echinata TaxID=191078 RepID=UPI002A7F2F51|nr:uncharacterized protein LOC133175165 [Saccostrea echinata]
MANKEENIPTPKQDMDTGTTTETDHKSEKRQWKPSEKGLEYFKEKKNVKITKIHRLWTEVEILQTTDWKDFKSISLLESFEFDLSEKYRVYSKLVSEYDEFVFRSEEDEAMQEYEEFTRDNQERKRRVEKAFKEIQERKQYLMETSSSHGSRLSARSGISVIAKKQAKVEAAKAKIKFSEQERDLLEEKFKVEEEEALTKIKTERRKAELTSSLSRLEHEKELAAAEAEVEALKTAGSELDRNEVSDILLPKQQENSEIRTNRYVNEHSGYTNLNPSARPFDPHSMRDPSYSPEFFRPLPQPRYHIHREQSPEHPALVNSNSSQNQVTSDLTRFLLRKDLLFARLTVFSEEPEAYLSWKRTFKQVMKELDVGPSEELELLIKWLGPVSSKYACSIKISNVNRPCVGVARLWERLDQRYGSPEMVEAALKKKLEYFPKLTNKEHKKLFELADILAEINSVKENPTYSTLLSYYDTSSGVLPIIQKLPYSIQEKWTARAVRYKKNHSAVFPPFSEFLDFIQEISYIKNDPGLNYDSNNNMEKPLSISRNRVNVKITDTNSNIKPIKTVFQHPKCILHPSSKHDLNECKAFRLKPIEERRRLLKDSRVCFKCCASKDHRKRDCTTAIVCKECGSHTHCTALHFDMTNERLKSRRQNGGEEPIKPLDIDSTCTEICGRSVDGKSCAKILPVYVTNKNIPQKQIKAYVILDEQSNKTLARSELFHFFGVDSTSMEYTLRSCSGQSQMFGRRSSGFIIQSVDLSTKIVLPEIIECRDIPNNRNEIPTPEAVRHYSHLCDIANELEPIDENAEILLLIGSDAIEAHHVLEQVVGPSNSPFAQRLKLGWVVMGEMCLGRNHKPDSISVCKTYHTSKGRPTVLPPCPNKFDVLEPTNCIPCLKSPDIINMKLASDVFMQTDLDETVGPSIEDRQFLSLMNKELHKDENGHWCAPLPFCVPRKKLPNNRAMAVQRSRSLERSLRQDPVKREHFFEFMDELLENKHAEVAPTLHSGEECWYLPVFGIYHPKKPGQIRCVFDSSATFKGVSLNSVLLSGPDLTNSLIGVLMRFRSEQTGIMADIQKMFYSFTVRESHRNFLRFLWYEDNDFDKDIIEYRMRVHVFGNKPSPAIANYALQRTAEIASETYGEDVKKFVQRNFYVDDALTSVPSAEEAINLLTRTKKALMNIGKIRLHKFASNSGEVMANLPLQDLSKELKNVDLDSDDLPIQRSLGLNWDLDSDSFTFRVSLKETPFTRRGVLSTVSSLFDPLGLIAPVTIQGKLILRDLVLGTVDWDEPLSEDHRAQWEQWRDSLTACENIFIPRAYSPVSLRKAVRVELHTFCDASERAIAAVSYLRSVYQDGTSHLGLLMGKAKVASKHGTTIPRLELCSAVLAAEVSNVVRRNLDINIDDVKFYTDSRIVLGYLHNETRRFYVYVANRVQHIRQSTCPEQWQYVPTQKNPTDLATRSVPADKMSNSMWLKGPRDFLDRHGDTSTLEVSKDSYSLVNPCEDKEVRPIEKVSVCLTKVRLGHSSELGSHRFERFSSWRRLVGAIAFLKQFIRNRKKPDESQRQRSVEMYQEAERFIVHTVQRETYATEISQLEQNIALSRNSHILPLDPFLDSEKALRVGGRIKHANIPAQEKHPLLIPGKHHIAKLLIGQVHENVQHQGRHITEGALRAAGFWVTGAKLLICTHIHNCVPCRKLRGSLEFQKMSDLPPDRLENSPPFTNVGVDVFGPWNIMTRRTRGGSAQSKRWAVMFSCLTTRAVHIELIEDMSSSALINAVRRFTAIRGEVKVFRSDRGTNFVGATDDLKIDAVNVEDGELKDYLYKSGTIWIFNAPCSSHMGGAWERMIGSARRILDAMLSKVADKHLTHDVLFTFMTEVAAILNNRPLVPVSTDAESPYILTPATLLTQKTADAFSARNLGEFTEKDLYRAEWRRVQSLSDHFWRRWRDEYLTTLQKRRKWTEVCANLKCGDIVLLRDKAANRNNWPMGIIEETFPCADKAVRKVRVRVAGNSLYTRPVNELVLLVST